eukprot:5660532-Prymnesium_polylepis.1
MAWAPAADKVQLSLLANITCRSLADCRRALVDAAGDENEAVAILTSEGAQLDAGGGPGTSEDAGGDQQPAVGSSIWVWWPVDSRWYAGDVLQIVDGEHLV